MTPSAGSTVAGVAAAMATLIAARSAARVPARVVPPIGDDRRDGDDGGGTAGRAAPGSRARHRPFALDAERLRHDGARVAVATVGLVVATMAVGPFGVALTAGCSVLLHRMRPVLDERRRRTAVDRELPDGIDLLVLGVHAGLTPRQSVDLLAHSGPESMRPACAEVIRRTERGRSFADALHAIRDTLGERAGVIADVIATADRYGFPLEPVLDQLATEARSARRRLDEADARRLPIRLSFPLVACTLPSFVLLAIAPAVIAALSSLGTTAW